MSAVGAATSPPNLSDADFRPLQVSQCDTPVAVIGHPQVDAATRTTPRPNQSAGTESLSESVIQPLATSRFGDAALATSAVASGCIVETSPEAALIPVPVIPVPATKVYYGWWMLLLAMIAAIATSPGQTFGVSIFNEPLRLELGLTHGQLAMAYMLGTLLGAIPITWFGRQMDFHGIRRTTLAILLGFAIACWTVSLASRWIELVVAFTLLRMLGPGALSLMSANTLPFWFHRRLGTVEGFRQTAMAIAMAVIPGFNLWLVLAVGWRGAFVVMGLGVLALWPIFYLWFRNRPDEVGQQIDEPTVKSRNKTFTNNGPVANFSLRQALRTSTFWSALVNSGLYSLIHTGVFFCLVPILVEKELDATYGAWMLMVFAISLAVHQMLGGWLADRIHPGIQMAGGQVMFSLGLTALLIGGGPIAILGAGMVMGAAQGVFFAASNPLWARYFGLKNLGAIRGFLMSFHVAFSSIGPLLVGSCHDIFDDFQWILLVFACLPLICGPFLFLIRPPQLPKN